VGNYTKTNILAIVDSQLELSPFIKHILTSSDLIARARYIEKCLVLVEIPIFLSFLSILRVVGSPLLNLYNVPPYRLKNLLG